MSCPHGMPKPVNCVDCMNEGPLPPPEKLQASFWLNAARFDGECKRCGGQIDEGDEIGKVEMYGWCCTRCVYPPGEDR